MKWLMLKVWDEEVAYIQEPIKVQLPRIQVLYAVLLTSHWAPYSVKALTILILSPTCSGVIILLFIYHPTIHSSSYNSHISQFSYRPTVHLSSYNSLIILPFTSLPISIILSFTNSMQFTYPTFIYRPTITCRPTVRLLYLYSFILWSHNSRINLLFSYRPASHSLSYNSPIVLKFFIHPTILLSFHYSCFILSVSSSHSATIQFETL
jgi:hypothetical protein